jgi:hypothetical protein
MPSKKSLGGTLHVRVRAAKAMIRNSCLEGNLMEAAAAGGSVLASPMAFPSADGPGQPLLSAVTSDQAPTLLRGVRPWPIAPVLIAALCGVGALSIALHDGLGLPAGWVAALTLAIAMPAGLLLARHLNRPLHVLARRAEQLSVRYTGCAGARGRNDFQNLVTSFDAITGALLAQLERVKGLHLEEMQNSLELQRRYALMRVLRNVSTAALECEHLEQVLERAVEELGGYLDWPIGRVVIVGEPGVGHDPNERSTWFVSDPERFAAFIKASETIGAEYSASSPIGLAGATGMPHWVTDLDRLPQWERHDVAVQSGLRSGFVIPIAGDGSTHAFLEFFADHRVEASAEMIELIEAIHTELWQASQWRRARVRRGQTRVSKDAVEEARERQTVGAMNR